MVSKTILTCFQNQNCAWMVKYEKQFYNAKNFKVFSVFSIIAHNISKKNLKYLKFV